MKKWLLGALALSVALWAGAIGDGDLYAQEKKTDKGGKEEKLPTTKEIMKKINGKGGLHKGVETDLKASPVKWDDVQKKTKEYNDLAEKFHKNKVPKGDEKSWEKLTKEMAAHTKAMNEAADKKDAKAVKAAWDKLKNSCGACHKEHKDD